MIMNKYVKDFLLRGMMFSGFGPIVLGVVYCILSYTVKDFSLTGLQVLVAIISTYLLAFIQAGASVFNQIEHWPLAKSMLFHFMFIYLAYSFCYIVNNWIPFEPMVLLVFTAIFVLVYLAIWLIVYIIIKDTSKKFNSMLAQ